MTQAYRIVDWKRRYEIKLDKRDATEDTPAERLRKKPHDFIKWKVFGHRLGHKYRAMIQKAWKPGEINELAVLGFFGKLLELAGDQKEPEFRGWILDEDQQPMTLRQIAELLDIQELGRLLEAMGILIDLNWVEKCEVELCLSSTQRAFFLKPQVSCKIVEKLLPLQKLQGAAKIATKACNPFLNETETEEKINLNEREASVSDCSSEVSDSASPGQAGIKQARQEALMEVLRLLRVSDNPSDITTFRDIFDQVERGVTGGEFTTKIFDRVINEAKEASGHRFGRIGRFINAMKRKPFSYIPENRQVTGSKFGKY